MTKWELLTRNATVDGDGGIGERAWAELQRLAGDGWELVSVVPFRYQTFSNDQTAALHLLYTFKRPLSE